MNIQLFLSLLRCKLHVQSFVWVLVIWLPLYKRKMQNSFKKTCTALQIQQVKPLLCHCNIPRWNCTSLTSTVLDFLCRANWHDAVTTLSIKSSAICISNWHNKQLPFYKTVTSPNVITTDHVSAWSCSGNQYFWLWPWRLWSWNVNRPVRRPWWHTYTYTFSRKCT